MEKRKSMDCLIQNNNHHHKPKLQTRKSLEIKINKEKEENYINEMEELKNVKSPGRNNLKGLITSYTISVNELKKNAPISNKAFKDFSLIQNQNESFRDYMEDRFSVLINFPNDEQCKALFAIFDGHGGSSVSQFLCQNFINTFLKISQKFDNKNMRKYFKNVFLH